MCQYSEILPPKLSPWARKCLTRKSKVTTGVWSNAYKHTTWIPRGFHVVSTWNPRGVFIGKQFRQHSCIAIIKQPWWLFKESIRNYPRVSGVLAKRYAGIKYEIRKFFLYLISVLSVFTCFFLPKINLYLNLKILKSKFL